MILLDMLYTKYKYLPLMLNTAAYISDTKCWNKGAYISLLSTKQNKHRIFSYNPVAYEAGGGSIIVRGKGMLMWMVQVSNYHASKHCFDTFRRDMHSFLCFQTANWFHYTSKIEYGEERK